MDYGRGDIAGGALQDGGRGGCHAALGKEESSWEDEEESENDSVDGS